MPWGKKGYLSYVPSTTWQADPQVERVLAEFPRGAVVLDLGAGGRRVRDDVVAVDFIPLGGTVVCGNVQELPFADGSVDLVIGTGLLEHVRDERRVMAEVHRVLRPGGVVHMEVPFLQQYHDDPIDQRRFTRPGLEDLCRMHGLEPDRAGVHIGPTVTMLTLSKYYVALWLEGRSLPARVLSTAAFAAVSTLGWPAKFLDRFLVHKASAHRLAFGVYCTARKSDRRAGRRSDRETEPGRADVTGT